MCDHQDITSTSRKTHKKKQWITSSFKPRSPSGGDPSSPPISCVPLSERSSGHQFADLRTQMAYEKMIKFDQKLATLSKREKEVKKQRRLPEEEMELEGLSLALATQFPRGSERYS